MFLPTTSLTVPAKTIIEESVEKMMRVYRFDSVVFNPRRKLLQVWRCQGGTPIIITDQVIWWLEREDQFCDVVKLIAKAVDLHWSKEEVMPPSHWEIDPESFRGQVEDGAWAYTFV